MSKVPLYGGLITWKKSSRCFSSSSSSIAHLSRPTESAFRAQRFPMRVQKLKLVAGDLTLFVRKIKFKLNQSTRIVKIDFYYTIRPFKRIPGTKVD